MSTVIWKQFLLTLIRSRVLGERIRAEEDMARLSYDLAKIERAVPIPDLPEDLKCISSEQSDSELLQFFFA